jgi:hypothetical protein
MNNEIVQYDKQGFIPSRDVKDIAGYLRESERKDNLLRSLKDNSQSVLMGNYRVAVLTSENLDAFIRKFDTQPFPVIVAEKKDFKEIYCADSPRSEFSYYGTLGSTAGSTIRPDKSLNLVIPIISTSISEHEQVMAHENVHALREQWGSSDAGIVAIMRSRLEDVVQGVVQNMVLEEAMAYVAHQPADTTAKDFVRTCAVYTTIYPLFFAPLLAPVLYPFYMVSKDNHFLGEHTAMKLVFLAPVLADAALNLAVLPSAIKAKKLMEKGKTENINPHYLFLRTNPNEFILKKPLEEQIAGKKGVRWDVIRARLGISKSNSD